MKKQFKRNLSILLTLAILISALSGIGITASAASITAEDLTGTKVDSETTLKPNDFNYNVQISNNQFTLGNNVIEIGQYNNAVDVELGESDVTVTLSAYKTAAGVSVGTWTLGGDSLITLSPKDGYTRIKSYSYEYKGSLSSAYSFPAVFKITESTDGQYNDAYIKAGVGGDNRIYYSGKKFTNGVSETLFRDKNVDLTVHTDKSVVYNFRVNVEYTYDDSGACQYVTNTYTYLSDADGNTDNLPAPIVKTFGLNKGRDTLSSLGVTAIEPLITVVTANTKIESNKAVSTYKNFTVNAVSTVDHTQNVLDFVNGNPIVIDIKNYSTADYSDKGTEALNAKSAFNALDPTVQGIITANGYYNSDLIDDIISHIGDIKKSDLTAGTTAVKEVTLSPSDFENINTVISNNKYGGSMYFPINPSNKFEVNSTDTDVVLTLTLPGNQDWWNAIDGKDFTTLTAEGLKIKSYSYEYVGTLGSRQAQPAVLKVTGGTSHVGSYISPMRYSADGFAKYVINDFTETNGVPVITENEVYSVSASSFDWNNTYNFKVDVEYTYDEKGACRGVTVTYNYRDKDDRSTENMPSPVSQTIDFTNGVIAGKNPSLAAQGIVAVEPVIALRLNLGKTTNKQLISTYSNLAVVADQTVDYTNDILNFVNAHKVLIDIKNGLDCSSRKDEVAAAKAAYEALTDDNLKNLIAVNGYYDADKINEITKPTAEEIASELTGTINMPGATVKMNQIDNNNQLRFTADYTEFKSVVTKYADRVAVTERGIRLLAGNKDAETLKTTGKVYTTSKDYISYEDDNGATKTGDYWVVGGTADYVSTKVSVLAYAKITVDGNEYTVYSDAISRSIVSVIRAILNAQEKTAVESARATVNTNGNTVYTYDDLMTNKVGTNTDKQAFVKAVFTQFCTDAGYIK